MLDGEEQSFLLGVARSAIADHLDGRSPRAHEPPAGNLTESRGAFVTLLAGDDLRGCIGHVEGILPLWRSVQENAVSAAFHDPRFPAVSRSELAGLTLEISALTPLVAVDSPELIEVGRHGVLVELGNHRGLLLPQVPVQFGWDRETFLDHTCRKAGLAPGAWREENVRLLVFEAQVFGEK
jgi:AmmeMemoRadiSam system protein A